MPSLVLHYRIDADDRIAEVSSTWDEFANANQGERAQAANVLGRSLWEFIADETISDIYRRLVKIARRGRRSEFKYRCDAPAIRRVFCLRINAEDDGSVVFASVLQSATPRPPIALLEAGRRDNDVLVRVCSWCHCVAWPGEAWIPLERSAERIQLLDAHQIPGLTHGICDPCSVAMFNLLRAST